MRTLPTALMLIGLISPLPTYAQLSLQQLQQQAYQLDPQLQYLIRQNETDNLRVQQSGRLANPEIAIQADNLGNASLKDLDGPNYAIQLNQAIPLTDKRSIKTALAQSQQANTALVIQQRKAQLNSDVRLCLANWYISTKQFELGRKDYEIAQSQALLLQEKYKAGKVVVSDAQRAQALSTEAAKKLDFLQHQTQQNKASCSLLTGGIDEPAFLLPVDYPDRQLTPLSQQQALFAQQQANLQHRLAEAERISDVTLSVGTRRYQQTGDQVLLLGASLPIPLFDQNRVARAEAVNQLSQAHDMVDLQGKRLAIQLKNARQRLTSNQQLLQALDQTVIPASEESLRIAQLAYQAGKTGLLEWIDARRTWREAQERRLEIWRNVQHTIAEIERETAPDYY